jgi:hypothetical protein
MEMKLLRCAIVFSIIGFMVVTPSFGGTSSVISTALYQRVGNDRDASAVAGGFASDAEDLSEELFEPDEAVMPDSCTFSVSDRIFEFDQEGGSGTIRISTEEDCSWYIASGVPWLAFKSDTDLVGTRELVFVVERNDDNVGRLAAVMIAGNIIIVEQQENGVMAKKAEDPAGPITLSMRLASR